MRRGFLSRRSAGKPRCQCQGGAMARMSPGRPIRPTTMATTVIKGPIPECVREPAVPPPSCGGAELQWCRARLLVL